VGRFRYGQIVEAYISDGTGKTKERPALIISGDEDNDEGRDLLMIAITRSIEDPRPDHHVIVHGDNQRDPVTGLNAPCVAKCHWVREIKQEKVIRSLGRMPIDLLKTVVETFDRIQADAGFGDWT
jgi:mRNA-degrading endonuclease toxin of MazEF toxin-antitoxin module